MLLSFPVISAANSVEHVPEQQEVVHGTQQRHEDPHPIWYDEPQYGLVPSEVVDVK